MPNVHETTVPSTIATVEKWFFYGITPENSFCLFFKLRNIHAGEVRPDSFGMLVDKAEGHYFWLAASNDFPATSGLGREKALIERHR